MQTFTPTGCDDTAALQTAVNSTSSLEVLAGTSKISAPLVIPHECEIVFRKGAQLLADHPSCDVLSVEAEWVRLVEPRIEAAVPRTGGSFVRLKAGAAHRFKSEGGRFRGYWAGFTIEQVATASILDLNCLGGVPGQGAAVVVLGGFDLTISDLLCDAPRDAQPAAGVLVLACGDLLLADSNIMNHGHDLLVQPGAGQVVASLWVSRTFLDTAIRGAFFNPIGGSIVRAKLSDVWVSGHSDQGVLMQGAGLDGADLSGVHAFLNGTSGIHLEGGAKNIQIIGGKVAANGDNGIAVGAGVVDFSVQDLTSGECEGLSGNGAWGMLVHGNGHSGYRIIGNDFRGNGAGGLYDPLLGAPKIVKDNLT